MGNGVNVAEAYGRVGTGVVNAAVDHGKVVQRTVTAGGRFVTKILTNR